MHITSLHKLAFTAIATLGLSMAVVACSNNSSNAEAQQDECTLDTAYRSLIVPVTETPVASGPVDYTVHRIEVHPPQGRLVEIFRDTNALQLTAARAVGLQPLNGLQGAYDTRHNVIKVASCDDYFVADLTYSMPFLVPRAAQLLHDIGRAFHDSVKARGGKEYRIKVTSLMRSSYSVSRLKRRNRAATDSSCHLYGTTFDISWTNFDCRDSSYIVSLEDLKNLLAEVIHEKREQGRCYAIFERKRGCFHVTVR